MCEYVISCADCYDPLDSEFNQGGDQTPITCPFCEDLICNFCIEDHIWNCSSDEVKKIFESFCITDPTIDDIEYHIGG